MNTRTPSTTTKAMTVRSRSGNACSTVGFSHSRPAPAGSADWLSDGLAAKELAAKEGVAKRGVDKRDMVTEDPGSVIRRSSCGECGCQPSRGSPSGLVQGGHVFKCVGARRAHLLQDLLHRAGDFKKTDLALQEGFNADLVRRIQDRGRSPAGLQGIARQPQRGKPLQVRLAELQPADGGKVEPRR